MTFEPYRTLLAVRSFLNNPEVHSNPAAAPSVNTIDASGTKESAASSATPEPRSNSFKAQVKRVMQQVLIERQQRLFSSEAVNVLIERGISITAKNPVNAVSSILSTDKTFSNKQDARGSGYGLREWDIEAQDVAPSSADRASPDLLDSASRHLSKDQPHSREHDPGLIPSTQDTEIKTADQHSLSAA